MTSRWLKGQLSEVFLAIGEPNFRLLLWFAFQVVGALILGLTLLSHILISTHGGGQVRAAAASRSPGSAATTHCSYAPTAGRSHRRPCRPLHHGRHHYGDRHRGRLWGPPGEQSVSDCGECWTHVLRLRSERVLSWRPAFSHSSWCAWLSGA